MNHYAKVIDIVTKEQDWKQIVLNIAKKYPSIVVECQVDTPFMAELKALAKEGRKIDAIKLYRTKYDVDLRTAKTFVDNMMDEL